MDDLTFAGMQLNPKTYGFTVPATRKMQRLVRAGGSGEVYVGFAEKDSSESAAVWLIFRIFESSGDFYVQSANTSAQSGSSAYTLTFSSRADYFDTANGILGTFCFSGDGINDLAFIANAALLFTIQSNTPHSIAFWAKLPGAGSGDQALIGKSVANTSFLGYGVNRDLNNLLSYYVSVNRAAGVIVAERRMQSAPTTGVWHRFVATYSGSRTAAGINLYQSGVLLTLDTLYDTLNTTTIISTSCDFQVGAKGNSGSSNGFYNGKIAWPTLVLKEMSQAEVTEDYNGGELVDPETLSFWSDVALALPLGNGDNDTDVLTNDLKNGTQMTLIGGSDWNEDSP